MTEFDRGGEAVQERGQAALLLFGSQSYHNIAQAIETLGADVAVLPGDTPIEELQEFDIVLLSGSNTSVTDEDITNPDPRLFTEEFEPPVVGICWGMQKMVQASGGQIVSGSGTGEYGPTKVMIMDGGQNGGVFEGMEEADFVMSHGDYVPLDGVSDGFRLLAKTDHSVSAVINDQLRQVGFQFHPELSGALGIGVFRNVLKWAGVKLDPRPERLVETVVNRISDETAADDHLLIALSGGIDSAAVTAAAGHSTVPKDRIHVVHMDTGTMRTFNGVPESTQVLEAARAQGLEPGFIDLRDEDIFNMPIRVEGNNGKDLGEHVLSETVDPVMKRLIFSAIYAHYLQDYSVGLGLDPETTKLVQGTLYPDVVESGAKGGATIKPHHNVTPFFQRLEEMGQLISPADTMLKPHMRKIGKELGLPPEIYLRHPFPGPGLIVRILCAVEPDLPDNAQEIYERAQEMVGDDFSVGLLPVRTVGQEGDERSYAHAISLTGERDWQQMRHLGGQVTSELAGIINRFIYFNGPKIEGVVPDITKTHVTAQTVAQLQAIDDKANRALEARGVHQVTDQIPIGLFPLPFGQAGDRSVVIRGFLTPESSAFISGEAAIPGKGGFEEQALDEAFEIVLAQPGISRVGYDLTSKPPGTTEFE